MKTNDTCKQENSRTLTKKLLLLAIPTLLVGSISCAKYGLVGFLMGLMAAFVVYFPLRIREFLHLGLVGTILAFAALLAVLAGLESILDSSLWVLLLFGLVILDVGYSFVKLKGNKTRADSHLDPAEEEVSDQ